MKYHQLHTFPVLIAVALALGASGESLAQSEPEEEPAQSEPVEELEMIELGRSYGEDEAANEDEIFEGLIYDQNAQQYRLLEGPEEEEPEEPLSQREQDTEEIGRLFALYKESLTSGNYLEADTLAKRIIELSIKVFGINSTESAKALTNLAIAQHNNKEYEAAERNYRASIDIIERISDRLNSFPPQTRTRFSKV